MLELANEYARRIMVRHPELCAPVDFRSRNLSQLRIVALVCEMLGIPGTDPRAADVLGEVGKVYAETVPNV
jgi:hypothetical protein